MLIIKLTLLTYLKYFISHNTSKYLKSGINLKESDLKGIRILWPKIWRHLISEVTSFSISSFWKRRTRLDLCWRRSTKTSKTTRTKGTTLSRKPFWCRQIVGKTATSLTKCSNGNNELTRLARHPKWIDVKTWKRQ